MQKFIILWLLLVILLTSSATSKAEVTTTEIVYLQIQTGTRTDLIQFFDVSLVGFVVPVNSTVTIFGSNSIVGGIYTKHSDAQSGGYRFDRITDHITTISARQNSSIFPVEPAPATIENIPVGNLYQTRPFTVQAGDLLVIWSGNIEQGTEYGIMEIKGVISFRFEPDILDSQAFQIAKMTDEGVTVSFPSIQTNNDILVISNRKITISLKRLRDGIIIDQASTLGTKPRYEFLEDQLADGVDFKITKLIELMSRPSANFQFYPAEIVRTNYQVKQILKLDTTGSTAVRFNPGALIRTIEGAPAVDLLRADNPSAGSNGKLNLIAVVQENSNADGLLYVKRGENMPLEIVTKPWFVEVCDDITVACPK